MPAIIRGGMKSLFFPLPAIIRGGTKSVFFPLPAMIRGGTKSVFFPLPAIIRGGTKSNAVSKLPETKNGTYVKVGRSSTNQQVRGSNSHPHISKIGRFVMKGCLRPKRRL